jgi:phosphocarrier protein HPr
MAEPDKSYRVLKICNKRGLHARASAKFVQVAENFDAEIRVSKDGHVVGGTSIMGLMMLAASDGCEIRVSVTGQDAEKALHALEKLVDSRFGEIE